MLEHGYMIVVQVIAVIPPIGNERSAFVWVSSSQITQRVVSCLSCHVCTTPAIHRHTFGSYVSGKHAASQHAPIPIHAPEGLSFPSDLFDFLRKQGTEKKNYVYIHVS
jgi:hypothetical protein